MDRTEFFFALIGVSAGALYVAAGQLDMFAKTIAGGFVLVVLVGLVSVLFVLHRLKTGHPNLYQEIGATTDDVGLGIGDANRRFMKFLRSSRHRDLDDGFLSMAVVVGRVTWRLSYFCAGFLFYFALRSLTK